MPVMRKAPKKLFTKDILCKGYGFHTPQDGSVCKIKVVLDEANLLTGLKDETKEIIVGDVDEPIERIIEDCIRTMKEEEECCIKFQHPDANTDHIIPVDSSDYTKETNSNVPYNCAEGENNSKAEIVSSDNCATDSDNEPNLQALSVNERETESIKTDLPDNVFSDSTSDTVVENAAELNESECTDPDPSHEVKIQLQLLSYTREPEIWEMSITEKWRRASYHKQRGLELYARGVYQYAFRRFGLTLKYVISLEHDVPSGQEEGMDIKGLKLSCYLNVAACQMRHHNFESVVINSAKALSLQPNNAKALYRRGAAYLQLQEYEKAKEDLTAAQQLEPKNQAIAKQLQVLKCRVQKLNQYYASAMKKMFS